jgi:hypothetical protein
MIFFFFFGYLLATNLTYHIGLENWEFFSFEI